MAIAKVHELKVVASEAEVSMDKKTRFAILNRDRHRCVYCGVTTDEARLEVDHIIPKAQGGTDDHWNLVAACRGCNRTKSKRSIRFTDLPDYVKQELRMDFSVDNDLGRISETYFGLSFRWDLPPCRRCGSHYTREVTAHFGRPTKFIDCSDCGATLPRQERSSGDDSPD